MQLWTRARGYKSKCPTFAACVMLTRFFAICPDGLMAEDPRMTLEDFWIRSHILNLTIHVYTQ